MEVIRDLASCRPPSGGSVVTIGAYDGVHRGHRALIDDLVGRAQARGAAAVLVTFDRHPAEVVRPASAPKLLTSLRQKLRLLGETGLDTVVVLPFDAERAAETADEFVRRVLVDALSAREVVVGADFHFGKDRGGDVKSLTEAGTTFGFEVDGIELVRVDGDEPPFSSTRARQALTDGRVDDAATILGRFHAVEGRVEQGDRRGRELGFPTANVAVDARLCLPADGIYAGWYRRADGERVAAAISLGRRPTFYEAQQQSLLEAHLLDFDGDLYGQDAEVAFVARLRGEEKFGSVDDLVAQMRRDVAATRDTLA